MILCLLTLLFFKLPRFPFLLLLLVRGEDDSLVYFVSSPVPTLTPTPVKPPISQVYFRHQNPPVLNPTPVASSLDPIHNNDIPITLRKGKRQCAHLIFSFVSYNHISSSSWSFVASLDSTTLPNTALEVLSHLVGAVL